LGAGVASRYLDGCTMRDAPEEFVPLAPLTTLGVGGPARFFVDAGDEARLIEALGWAKQRGIATRILGGGSNVVVGDGGVDALVVRLSTRGRTFTEASGAVHVEAAAGESWDDLVRDAVGQNLQGLECLSGIPGCVGATPIQNVGAYGQEVSETIAGVRALDRHTLEVVELAAADCGFGYRDSRLKSVEPERFVVLSVRFALSRGAPPALRYAELSRHFAERDQPEPSLDEVRTAVIALRRLKSMVLDETDENRRSCGSFFTNPVVPAAHADEVARSLATPMPRYPQPDGRVKLAAGWLIEQAGFAKGLRRGNVGLSTRHALAIVCHDGARADDVLALAREITAGVRARFAVDLVPEPAIWSA